MEEFKIAPLTISAVKAPTGNNYQCWYEIFEPNYRYLGLTDEEWESVWEAYRR